MTELERLGAIARRRRQERTPKVTIAELAREIGIGSTKLGKFELGQDALSAPLRAKVERYFNWPQGSIERAEKGEQVVADLEPTAASRPERVGQIIRALHELVDELARAVGIH